MFTFSTGAGACRDNIGDSRSDSRMTMTAEGTAEENHNHLDIQEVFLVPEAKTAAVKRARAEVHLVKFMFILINLNFSTNNS